MTATPIGRLRLAGMLEGASFLVLLGIAMPLKYMWGEPLAVRIVGMIHGILFLVLCGLLKQTKDEMGWTWRRAATVLIAALIPFGPFVIDASLKREDAANTGVTTG